MNIRRMVVADLPRIMDIERVTLGARWSLGTFQNELSNSASSYMVAVQDREIIGYCGYWLILEEAHITAIAVDPKHQGNGYGELLLLSLIDHAERAGAKWITLEVRVSNVAAQKLYEKYGFTSLGKRKAYYQDNGEDALIMWTENIGQPQYKQRLASLREALAKRGTTVKEPFAPRSEREPLEG